MFRASKVQTDRQALLHNLKVLKRQTGDAFFCPMVKANAYGHGDVIAAQVVEEFGQASAIGVALVEEGIRLREAGLRLPILVFTPFTRAAAEAMVLHRLTPLVGRLEDLKILSGLQENLKVHLKFNTGMNRLGFDQAELPELKKQLAQLPKLQIEGICSHLTHGEEALEPEGFTNRQIARLRSMVSGLPGALHIHKSASLAVLAENGLRKAPDLGARVGISYYGLPYDGEKTAPELRPALKWSTELVRIHPVEKGDAVSYGARWVAPRRSWIGVLPVGYGDGYMRALSNCGEVLFRGQKVAVTGSVCMDYTLIDLTDASNQGLPQTGEEVVLIGRQGANEIGAGLLAKQAGTIAYEIVTAIGARVAREAI